MLFVAVWTWWIGRLMEFELPDFKFGRKVDALEWAFFVGSLLMGTSLTFHLKVHGEPVTGEVIGWESNLNEQFILIQRENDELAEIPLSIIKEVVYL